MHKTVTAITGAAALVAAAAIGLFFAAGLASAVPGRQTASATAPAPTLGPIAFAAPARGYGLFTGRSSNNIRCTESVGSTSDGGAVFGHLAAVLSYNCADLSPAAGLATDGRGDLFVYGPGLFVSHDGGRGWTRSAEPGRVLSVEAIGRSVWMVQAVCPHPATAASACALRLTESANGGRTWRARQAPAGSAVASDSPALLTGLQTWLLRTGPSSAYLFGAPGGAHGIAPLWYTATAGRTWSKRQLTCSRAASWYVAASVAPEETLFAVCAGEPSAGNQFKVAARSTTGGRTWTLHGCPNGQAFCNDTLTGGYLGQISAISASTAFLVGSRSQLLVTRDGGAKWQGVRAVTAGQGGSTGQVIFFGAKDGIVTGNDDNANEQIALWHTTDGGERWTVVLPRIS
jgi:photosystem II stability/assembly factor-like uncharacterized protein